MLCASLSLCLVACFKKTPEPQPTSESTTQSVSAAQQKEDVIQYPVLEDILSKYAYGYIGGCMPFVQREGKLYFADHQYNTGSVNYYDFSSGSVKNLAIDNNNPLSGGPMFASHSIVVASYPEGSDPLEVDNSQKSLHVYDLETGKLFTAQTKFDFIVNAYQHGKVYGLDEKGNLCIADDNANIIQTIPIQLNSVEGIYEIGGETFAALCNYADSALNSRRIVRFKGDGYETVAEIACAPFFDGESFYYIKYEGDGPQKSVKRYNVQSGEAELLFTTEQASYLYFAAGERVYFSSPVGGDDYNINLNYHDLKTGEEAVFSTDMPALGGW